MRVLLFTTTFMVLASGVAPAQPETESDALSGEVLSDQHHRGLQVHLVDREERPEGNDDQEVSSGKARSTGLVHEHPVSELIGKQVANARGESLGRVRDVALDKSNRAFIVVEVGGRLGTGGKPIPIGLNNVEHRDDQLIWMTEMPKSQLGGILELRPEDYQLVEYGRTSRDRGSHDDPR